MNYKDTLNLPHTDFSMKANLRVLEPKMITHWRSLDVYQTLRKIRKNAKKFILHDGPPYANGSIHIGHALNKILKDIIIKYKILKGYDCPYIVGWDCHGLPVEHQLFKELKLTKHDVEVADFRKKAKDYALRFVDSQRDDFKRLGLFSDWDNPYFTLDSQYEYSVVKLLENLLSQGYIYRGRKPVNWCSSCETALAEAEVEYFDKESDSIYFLFRVIDAKGIFSLNKKLSVYFLVWTTTPWTLVSNVAVAVHPKLAYCLVEFQEKLVVVGKDLIAALQEKFGTEFKILKEFKGVELEGLGLMHPFFDRNSKVVLADFVSSKEGSGCVHLAPGHGEEDFSLVKKYSLEIIMPVNDKGVFQEPPEFNGRGIKQANELVLDKLNNNKFLIKHEKITHSYPHCWRCKKPVIFRATFQWFFNVDHKGLRKKLLDAAEKVKWVPASGKERMKSMLITRPDWCLSRQRLWGIPIPAVKCESCQRVILDKGIVSRTAEVFSEYGSDAWFIYDLDKFIPHEFSCPDCGKRNFTKEFDILDVWFESGASFLAVVKNNPELKFPADLYLEGSDQHRGWFQVSLIASVAKEAKAPFETVLTHGFVVDSQGRKMSKSLGNVIGPQKISQQYGAEILRFWAAYTDYSEDVKISQDILKQLVDMYRKIRNTIRFILGNISDFKLEENNFSLEQLREVDRFMAARAMLVFKEVTSCYENYSFYKVCQKMFNFCNLDLSSFYLDILKDRLYTFLPNSAPRRSAQFVLYHILKILLKMMAPILSFTAEEAYLSWAEGKDKKRSVFISGADDDFCQDWIDNELISRWEKILHLRSQVLKEIEKKREFGKIGSSLEVEVTLSVKGKDYKFFLGYQEALREVFIVSSVRVEEGDFEICVEKAGGLKCLRCWNRKESVGSDKQQPDICSTCIDILKEAKI
ncbi:MAG: isoleucine--tRNA ligase [Omnitrophica bacterium]|nr:isoleucine--tRNA ligase [Candidatus Omnitrophota bacterium]